MKKTLSTALLLAAAVAAAGEEPVTMQAPAPAPDLKPEFTVEAIQNYGSLESNGLRIGASIYKSSIHPGVTHQYSLSLGYASNDSYDTETTYIPLTVSYHVNKQLCDKATLYAGVRAGAIFARYEAFQWEDNDWGPYIGVGAGLKYQITENTHLQAGYEVGKYYPHEDGTANYNVRTFSLGVGVKF